MMRRLFSGALLGLLLSGSVQAEVYMYRDAAGNPVFTDRPVGETRTPVPLPTINEWSAPPPASPPPATEPAPAKPALTYRTVQILAPAMDTTIRDNAGNISVQVTSEPPLHAGHRYRLLVDGTPAGADQTGTRFLLQNVDRGTHQLSVAILDDQARMVAQSQTVSVHVKRMTLAERRRVQPCRLEDYGVRLECPLKDKPAKRDIPFVPFI